MYIWTIATVNQLFIRGSFIQINFSKKEVVREQPFFAIGTQVLPIQFALTLAFDRAVFYGNVRLSFVVFSTKTSYFSSSRKYFDFQKTCFKVKVLKTFKILSDYHIKTCRSTKRRAILKIPRTAFQRNIRSFYWLKIKPLRGSAFLC